MNSLEGEPPSIPMPTAGTVRLQPSEYRSVFREPKRPRSVVLQWLRENVPGLGSAPPSGRFDDPRGEFSVTYSGTSLRDAAIEMFDSYRVDEVTRELATAVRRPAGEVFAFPVGSVPRTEMEGKAIWTIFTSIPHVDVMHTVAQTWLSTRNQVARQVRRSTGREMVDTGVLLASGTSARRVTRAISREVYEAPDEFGGVRYASRIGQGHENWATYERSQPDSTGPIPVDANEPELRAALHELGLYVLE